MTIQENRPAAMTAEAEIGAGAVAPSVGQFSADDLGLGYETTLGQEPTIMVNVPVSRSLIEAACLNAAAIQTGDNIPVTPERIASWGEDEIRSWALSEVLLFGAGAAMNTADYVARPEQALMEEELKDSLSSLGPVHELIRERIGSAFGFDAQHDEAGHTEAADEYEPLEDAPMVAVDQDDDDGWEL